MTVAACSLGARAGSFPLTIPAKISWSPLPTRSRFVIDVCSRVAGVAAQLVHHVAQLPERSAVAAPFAWSRPVRSPPRPRQAFLPNCTAARGVRRCSHGFSGRSDRGGMDVPDLRLYGRFAARHRRAPPLFSGADAYAPRTVP